MLTRVDYPSIAGINGVAWDAVELPSQFMENFAWRAGGAAAHLSARVDRRTAAATGTRAPAWVANLPGGNADGSATGIRAVRPAHPQRECPFVSVQIMQTLAEVRALVAVVKPPAFNRFPHSFQHIFSGGYAAGYYSYKWAEVLAADAFSAFEESGIFDEQIAHRFLTSILEQGGSRDAMDAFVEFRGRKPQIEPLLKQLGLAA